MNEISQTHKAIELLSLWTNKINLSSAIDFYDINRVAENLATNLLNEIYGYQLKNLNTEQRNFPAVDLGCDVQKIAFQITSTKEPDKVKEKIESTLEKFIHHNLQSRFTSGVRFLFLTTDKLVKLTDANKKKYQGIYSGFDEKHLLTLQDLIQKIQVLYNEDNGKFCRVLKILERELSSESSDVAEIVKVLTNKYQQESQAKDEQIKALTHAITALSQNHGVIGTEAQINSAFTALKHGDITEAKTLFAKAAEKAESVIQSESQKAAEAYRNLGALAFLDNTQEALNAYRRATELDPDNAYDWNQIGVLLSHTHNLNQALIAFQKVLALGEIHNNQDEISMACFNLSTVYQSLGEFSKSVEIGNKGLVIDEALGNTNEMAHHYGNLGFFYQMQGIFGKANEMYNKSLAIYEASNNKEGISNTFKRIGYWFDALRLFDKATEMYNKSLVIDKEIDDKKGIAINYGNLGTVYYALGDLDKAVEMYQKSLDITESLSMKDVSANQYLNLGLVYKQKDNKAEAKHYWQKSVELYKQLGSPMEKTVQNWLDTLQ